MLLSIVPRWPASGCSKVPSPSLTESARPASQRPRCASAPRMPVITSPSMRMAPVSASPWPSKPPTVARPQAVRPVPPPPPAPSKARWNELPSSSSRPVTERTGEPPLGAGLSQAPPCRSGHAPGAVTPLAAAPPGAPKARARPVIASTRTALSPVRERSTLCPASVTCAPASGADSRPATASTTWSATVRPKRDSHIFCNGSLFDTVPVASASAMRAPVAFESRSVKVSSPSSITSSSTGTDTNSPSIDYQ